MAASALETSLSPYLRLHKDNPVAWRTWSPQVLAEAEASGKPIFLSIGYTGCHWCHVMNAESFSDPATAAIINENFIPVLVDRAEDWLWGSLCVRRSKPSPEKPRLSEWPVEMPRNWLAEVNRKMSDRRAEEVRTSILRGTPLGSETWKKRVAARLGLELTLRPRGRPRKASGKSS